MKELKTQMDSLSLSVRDLKSEKKISVRKFFAVSRESQHSIPIENDDRTWEQRIEDPKEYSEEYAATILSEMMKDCDDSLIQKDEEFRRQQQNEYKHWKELRERGQETKAHHCVASKDKGDKSITFQDLETILKHMISQSKSLYCSDEDTFKDMCEQFEKEFALAKGMQSLDLKKLESHLKQIWQDASSVLSITNAKQLEEYGEELQNAMYAVIASVEEDGSTPISEVKQLKRLLDAIQTATGLISGMNEEDY